jgi:ABC-type phosphate transport system substrate-binding protein
MKTRVVVSILAALTSFGTAAREVRGGGHGFQVIVHPSVPGASIERKVLSQVFLKTALRWSDKRRIEPVDLTSTSPVRETFVGAVHGMSTAQVSSYWMKAIAAGTVPPVTRANDQQVIEFVASRPGSVGYVSAGTELPPTVKPLSLK